MIVKFQKSQFPTNSNKVLMYDMNNKIHQEVPMDANIAAVLGNRDKVYCKCKLKNGILHIGERVPDRSW